MEELWKPITCLPEQDEMKSRYEASNLGRIRNVMTQHVIKPHTINSGYNTFQYHVYPSDGSPRKYKAKLWHRIIAETWLPNPDNLPQVDHIDDDRNNNEVANLQWIDASSNVRKSQQGRPKKKYGNKYAPVFLLDPHGAIVKMYDNAKAAADAHGISVSRVMRICCGDAAGYAFGSFTQEGYLNKRGKTAVLADGVYTIQDLTS